VIDLKILRDDPERVRLSQKVSGESVEIVDQLLALDEARRSAITDFEALRAEQKYSLKVCGRSKREMRRQFSWRALKELSARVKIADALRAEAEIAANEALLQIHNLISPEAPVGGEADFVVLNMSVPLAILRQMVLWQRIMLNLARFLKQLIPSAEQSIWFTLLLFNWSRSLLLEFALVNYAISSATQKLASFP
jgi:seryl-tRNA synthetase